MAMDLGKILPSMDPFESFKGWLSEAERKMDLEEATAMTLATVSGEGRPSARIVLYKGLAQNEHDETGFRIFTNYDSEKSRDLAATAKAALVFFWAPFRRQVRIEGRVERLTESESDAYFASRPRGSQIGAWASPQSQKIKSRDELLERVRKIEEKFKSASIPRPPNWGGWLLIPDKIEFWQASEHRLHDRFLFEKSDLGWQVSRLAP